MMNFVCRKNGIEIPGHSDYIIFSDGKIYSKISHKFIKARLNCKGYYIVTLKKVNGKKDFLLHRLLAEAFIPNPENKPCIDHIDCDRTNNSINNLRWVTYRENNLNPITHKRLAHGNSMRGKFGKEHHLSKKVLCFNRSGRFITEYEGVHDASRKTGINRGDIGSCCRGQRKTAGDFIWKYAI